ncbi:DUF1850 domain-containing protein [Anaerobacillus sp. MEB173]|uniref:DUF1850 domain-containing protein n=1 Tax=Anaerobacillus sp. MEB173 TaxID=3383345 RepID=UPI003F937159
MRFLTNTFMNVKKIVLLSIAVMIVLYAGYWTMTHSTQELVIREQHNHKEYFRMAVSEGDELTMSWIHSVEKTPWLEVYEVTSDNKLRLKETRFQSYGAGVPEHIDGDLKVVDGYTVITGIDTDFPNLQWLHSQKANFTFYLNDELIFEGIDLPHHIPMEIRIEKE